MNNLAETHLDAGRPEQARLLAQESLAIAEDTGDGRVEADACHTLAALERAAGRAGTAWDERSLAVADVSGNARAKALALIGLSRDRLAAGARAEATAAARTALETASRAGYRLIEEEAAATLVETDSPERLGDHSVIQ